MKKLVLAACFFAFFAQAGDKIITYTSRLSQNSVALQIVPKKNPHAIIATSVLPGESVAITVPGGGIEQLMIEDNKGLKEVWLAYKKDPARKIKRKRTVHVYYDRDRELNGKTEYVIKKMPVVGFTIN